MSAEILKMIETVDPSDKTVLDAIDKAVMSYLNQREYEWRDLDGDWGEHQATFVYWEADSEGTRYQVIGRVYTRSRDALKEIRPEGWVFDHFVHRAKCEIPELLSYSCTAYSPRWGFESLESEHLPTEELAELHAIIQAIEYERSTAQREE